MNLSKAIAGALCLVLLGEFAQAQSQSSTMRRLQTADEARAWRAVGRLNVGKHSFCTASLVAPDLVLTAAHCLFNPDTGRPVDSSTVEFLAGWRNGTAVAYRKAKRFVIHRDYDFNQRVVLKRVASDVALVELESPIRDGSITPFKRFARPNVGADVKVVSYAKERSEVPSIEEPCNVLDTDATSLVLSCSVNFGASGSPIFVDDNGEAKIASVVSAMARWRDRDVSLGVSLGRPLDDLFALLQETSSAFKSKRPGTQSLSEQLGGLNGGTAFFK